MAARLVKGTGFEGYPGCHSVGHGLNKSKVDMIVYGLCYTKQVYLEKQYTNTIQNTQHTTNLADGVTSVGALHQEVQIRREKVFHHARHALTKHAPRVHSVLSHKIDLTGKTRD